MQICRTAAPSIAALVFFACIAACGSVRVRTDYDPEADFSGLHSFAWLPGPQPRTGDPRIDNPLLDERIRAAVDSTLIDRGYQKLASGTPDFWVGYHLSLDTRLDVSTIDGHYGYGRHRAWTGGVPNTYVREYEEGTLILDVVDAKQDRLVWRGSGSRALSRAPTPEQSATTVNNAVRDILKRFPPE